MLESSRTLAEVSVREMDRPSSDSTYAAYPYAASIACPGVTASHVPEVVFGATEAASGNFAPVALSGSGTVKIYAATKPTAAITVQSITCIKAVS